MILFAYLGGGDRFLQSLVLQPFSNVMVIIDEVSNLQRGQIQVPIQLLESPIPTPATTTTSQKASSGDISGTKRGIIDPLVSKQPEKF